LGLLDNGCAGGDKVEVLFAVGRRTVLLVRLEFFRRSSALEGMRRSDFIRVPRLVVTLLLH